MKFYKIFITLIIVYSFYSCSQNIISNQNINSINSFIYFTMLDNYLWNDRITNMNYESFTNYDDLLNSLKVPEDKWSFIWTKEQHYNYFVAGKNYGYGYSYIIDYQNNLLLVTLVYPDTPASKAGLKRSHKIFEVNGTNISIILSNKLLDIIGPTTSQNEKRILKVLDYQSNIIEITMYSDEYNIKSVITNMIIITNSKKIGYLLFNSFIQNSYSELKEVFRKFKDANINELIVDLRYNGGGYLGVAITLGSLIGGKKVENKVFASLLHNNKNWAKNLNYYFEKYVESIDWLSNVYFITTKNTASASENTINGLKPFMNVYLIGSDTHGKPVGMYTYEYSNIVLLPVCFKTANAIGYGDYFDGIKCDSIVDDSINRDFGDLEESMLKHTINFIFNKQVVAKLPDIKLLNLTNNQIIYADKYFRGLIKDK